MRHGLTCLSVLFAVVTAACGGGDTPTAPTSTSSFTAGGSGASIVSCNSVRYQSQTLDVCRPITGQSVQPIGSTHFFPGRSDCLKVSCSNGCATSVAVGVATGGSCQ